MAQGTFTAQVTAWVNENKARREAVAKESMQRVIEVMQRPIGAGGNMPIDTGFLRASLTAVIGDSLPPARTNPGEGKHGYDGGQISLVIASAELNQVVTAAYTANYARHVNYGARGRQGRRFVDLAAQQWPRIVAEVSAEAKARAG